MSVIDEMNPGTADGKVRVLGHHGFVDQFGERAGRLDTGRPCPDDDKVQGAFVEELGVAACVFKHLQDAGAQTQGVVEAVHGKRVPVGARGLEKVRLRARREDQVIALVDFARGGGRRFRLGIDGGHLGQFHVHVCGPVENFAQRVCHIAWRELRRGHLVQERLKLVVIVLVQQRDPHVGVPREFPRTGNSREAAADDDDVFTRACRCHRCLLRLNRFR